MKTETPAKVDGAGYVALIRWDHGRETNPRPGRACVGWAVLCGQPLREMSDWSFQPLMASHAAWSQRFALRHVIKDAKALGFRFDDRSAAVDAAKATRIRGPIRIIACGLPTRAEDT